MSLYNKIKLFNSYKSTINSIRIELLAKYMIKIDRAYRMYTVLNIPPNLIGDNYSLKRSDIDKISEGYIKEYIKSFSNFLDEKNLRELYKSYDIKKVDKYSYLLVFGYSLFNSVKYYNNIYYKLLPLSIIILGIIIYVLI